jgi:predicted CXXCH cytochrome family protein
VDQGACTQCHDPHASSYATLLLGEGPELCGDCHEEVAEEIEESEYVHDPVEDSCLDCHAPHSSPYPKILLESKRQLCNECHDDVVETAQDASVPHEPTTTKDECLNCHAPHASNHEYNLKKAPTDLCLSCHDEPLEVDGVKLLDMKRWLKRNPQWHEPIREEGCNACHQPHGGENRRLLTEAYSTRMYVKFSVEEYALCFRCHEKELATSRRTRSLTGFRDGSRNLHFLHVNKEKRGRSCRLCHDVHATQNPKQLRTTSPYGKWDMPLNFVEKDTGGSCHPGCHRLRSYDRQAKDRPGG